MLDQKQNKNSSVKTIKDLDLSGLSDEDRVFLEKHLKPEDDVVAGLIKFVDIATNADKKINEQGNELGFLRSKNENLNKAIAAMESGGGSTDSTEGNQSGSSSDADAQVAEKLRKLDEVLENLKGVEERLIERVENVESLKSNREKQDIINKGLDDIARIFGDDGERVVGMLVDRSSTDPSKSPLLQVLFDKGMSALWRTDNPVVMAAKLLLPAEQSAKLGTKKQSEAGGQGKNIGNKSDVDKFFEGMPETIKI